MTLKQIKKILSSFSLVIDRRTDGTGYSVRGDSMSGVPGSMFLILRADKARLERLAMAAQNYVGPGGYVAPAVKQRAIVRASSTPALREADVAA